MATFSIINYLSGLTGFVFDKAVLERVALEQGVQDITEFSDLTTEQKDLCKIALLETLLTTPNSTASDTNTHGAYTHTVGSQIITEDVRENIKSQLRVLYNKYEMADELNAMDDGNLTWINENSLDY